LPTAVSVFPRTTLLASLSRFSPPRENKEPALACGWPAELSADWAARFRCAAACVQAGAGPAFLSFFPHDCQKVPAHSLNYCGGHGLTETITPREALLLASKEGSSAGQLNIQRAHLICDCQKLACISFANLAGRAALKHRFMPLVGASHDTSPFKSRGLGRSLRIVPC
jgi:hypothetical protein